MPFEVNVKVRRLSVPTLGNLESGAFGARLMKKWDAAQ
jgi:hypothetical protein